MGEIFANIIHVFKFENNALVTLFIFFKKCFSTRHITEVQYRKRYCIQSWPLWPFPLIATWNIYKHFILHNPLFVTNNGHPVNALWLFCKGILCYYRKWNEILCYFWDVLGRYHLISFEQLQFQSKLNTNKVAEMAIKKIEFICKG